MAIRGSLERTLVLLGCLVLPPNAARADGALPDSQSLLTPADRPLEIILVTNFGVVTSEDAGATWTWSCEQDVNAYGRLYQLGAPPRHRLFALANQRVIYSDDGTCSWAVGAGSLAAQRVSDVWVDRTIPDRVWAVGDACCTAGKDVYAAFESTDGGETFATLRYTAVPGLQITGVETAASDPQTVYLTVADTSATPPAGLLVVSSDGGETWASHDLSPEVGSGVLGIIAVDQNDAQRVYLSWNGQALVVTPDGGSTATKPFVAETGGFLQTFLRTAAGSLLLGASDANGTTLLYRSTDGAASFAAVPGAPQIRGFSERDGLLYAATNDASDGFALATSTDEGTTWRGVMAYDQISAIAGCVKAACQATCETEVQAKLWTNSVCVADLPPPSGDSGADASAGGAEPGGCGCRTSTGAPRNSGIILGIAALAAWLGRRRRRIPPAGGIFLNRRPRLKKLPRV